MSLEVTLAVLGAALAHAVWNALVKSSRNALLDTALVAFFSALAALAVTNGHDAHAHGIQHHRAAAPAAMITPKQLALRNDMRVLWEDHVMWTRLAVISLVAGTPDTQATVERLLQNQADIGNALKPFYGRAAGDFRARVERRFRATRHLF